MEIKLQQSWLIDGDQSIGRGGFGVVRPGSGADGRAVAVKFIPKMQGGTRDLLVGDMPPHPNLVPILDAGESGDDFAIVMPRAEYSLRDLMQASGSPVPLPKTIRILTDIAQGLEALDGKVVHRDLKPDNILFIEGNWAICDFGIARYSDATTAADTKKFSLSPPYAAPEQWRLERATSATDIYAFGVVAFELVSGAPPFTGPSNDDYRSQHLYEESPAAPAGRKLSGLINECLFKAPATRPTAPNIIARLGRVLDDASRPGASALAQAQGEAVQRASEQARLAEIARTEAEHREALYKVALKSYSQIVGDLVEVVGEHAPLAVVVSQDSGVRINLERGWLALCEVSRAAPPRRNDDRNDDPDVIAYGSLSIRQDPPGEQGYPGRSHSLYFCDFDERGKYGWYEVAFMSSGGAYGTDVVPFDMPPANATLSLFEHYSADHRLARPFERLTPSDMDETVDRWVGYLGSAARGELQQPWILPEGNPIEPRMQRFV
jgi:serine/threonine-protein kinase